MGKNQRNTRISRREEANAERVIKAIFIGFMVLALILLAAYAIYA
ncbi:MAG: hypothetical protein ACRCUJ_09510 [Phocaeicola sp.]